MKSVDPGILSHSCCFNMTPSDIAKKLYFYPTWCGHYYCTDKYFMKRQCYKYMILIFVRKGMMHAEFRGGSVEAREGEILLIDCTEPHYYHAHNGLELLYIHFDGSNSQELSHFIIERRGWHIVSESNYLIANLLNDMVNFYENIGIEPDFDASRRIYQLFELLLKPLGDGDILNNPISRTMYYMRNNFAKDITLEELAEVANLSVYYYSHSFRRQAGISPIAYLIQTRMERSKTLLTSTSKNISEIAYEVGYSSSASFINQFTRRTGLTPKSYRDSHSPG